MFLKIFQKHATESASWVREGVTGCSFLRQHEFFVLTVGLGKNLFRQSKLISSKICKLRAEMFREYGFMLPEVKICVNKKLKTTGFSIMVRGNCIYDSVSDSDYAASAICQQLTKALFQYTEYILTRDTALKLLKIYAAHSPEARFIMQQYESKFNLLSNFHKLLIALLKEHIPIRDIDIIAGTLADNDENTGLNKLIELTRIRLSLLVTERAQKRNGRIKAFFLSDRTQEFVDDAVTEKDAQLRMDLPYSKNKELRQLLNENLKAKLKAGDSIILVEQQIRRKLYFLIKNITGIEITVISFDEINRQVSPKIDVLGEIDFVLSDREDLSDKEIRLDEFFIH